MGIKAIFSLNLWKKFKIVQVGKKYKYLLTGLVLFTLSYLALEFNRKIDRDNYLHQRTMHYTQDYASMYKEYKRLSEVIFATTINTPEVQSLFYKRDREGLYNYLSSTYALLKKNNVKQFQFHLPNNHSFLRLHKPNKYDDDLTNIRATVKYVNTKRKPIDGFEIGRVYGGYRFVFPMFYKKEYIGSVETSFSILAFTVEFSKIQNAVCNFLISKKFADEKGFTSDKRNYISSPYKDFYREGKATQYIGKMFHANMQLGVSADTQKLINSLSKQKSSFSVYDSVEDKILTFLKVTNPLTGETNGLFVARTDAKFIHKQELTFKIFLATLFFGIAIILFFLYRDEKYKVNLLALIKQDKIHKNLIDKNIIISTTDTKGIIMEVSEAFVNISGYKEEELIGQPHNIIRHPDMSEETFKELWETIKNAKTWSGTVKNRTKSGGYYWVDTTIEPMFANNNEIIGYIAVRQNITDTIELAALNKSLESRIESEVQKNREKDNAMLQQSRLAQMGEMISMIAHQWRQPLTAISATSGNLTLKAKLEMLDNETAVELGEKISSYSQHLSSTIDDFRDFFKPNKQLVDTTYTELVQNVLSIVADSLDTKNIKLKQELQSEVTFSSYPNELKQVILNLIKNAEDILLEKEIKYPVISIETQDNILRVKDNAGGVPKEIIEKVFDPYFSTKTQKDGTGLGLYMSKTIIEEHCGGELRVYNDEDGAVFEMKLPVKKDLDL